MEKILEFQRLMAEKKQLVDRINQQLATHQSDLEEKKVYGGNLENLSKLRNELLARVVLGEAEDYHVKECDQDIAEAQKIANEAAKISDIVDGLKRRLAVTLEDIDILELDHKSAIAEYVRLEAEKVGEEYIERAAHVVECFDRLVILDQLHRFYDVDNAKRFSFINAIDDFCLPVFNLDSHRSERSNSLISKRNGMQMIVRSKNVRDGLGMTKEKDRLTALGVIL